MGLIALDDRWIKTLAAWAAPLSRLFSYILSVDFADTQRKQEP